MTFRKRPKPFVIFSKQMRMGLKTNQIGYRDKSGEKDGAVVHENLYRAMLKGESQTDDVYALIAKRLELSVEDITYALDETELDRFDEAIVALTEKPQPKCLRELIGEKTQGDYRRPVSCVYAIAMMGDDERQSLRADIESKMSEWGEEEQAATQQVLELIFKPASVANAGAATSLREVAKKHRIAILRNAESLLNNCEGTRKLINMAMGKSGLSGAELVATLCEDPDPITPFLQLIHNIRGLNLDSTPIKTLLAFRDAVACLSLPASHDLKIRQQIDGRETFVDMPTRERRIARHHLGLARGVVPKDPVDLSAHIALRVEEGIVGVHDPHVLQLPEPPEGGVEDRDFVKDFLNGISVAFDSPWFEDDPQRNVDDINGFLNTLASVDAFVCVFFSETPSETEVSKLKKLFPMIDFIREPREDSSEYRQLKFKLRIIDGHLEPNERPE